MLKVSNTYHFGQLSTREYLAKNKNNNQKEEQRTFNAHIQLNIDISISVWSGHFVRGLLVDG